MMKDKMINETQPTRRVEKPWAIVFSHYGLESIGKILRDWNDGIKIAYSEDYEKNSEILEISGQIYIRRFDTPTEVRDYLRENYSGNALLNGIFNNFLRGFPNTCLEMRVEQRLPKCTEPAFTPSKPEVDPEDSYEQNPNFPNGVRALPSLTEEERRRYTLEQSNIS